MREMAGQHIAQLMHGAGQGEKEYYADDTDQSRRGVGCGPTDGHADRSPAKQQQGKHGIHAHGIEFDPVKPPDRAGKKTEGKENAQCDFEYQQLPDLFVIALPQCVQQREDRQQQHQRKPGGGKSNRIETVGQGNRRQIFCLGGCDRVFAENQRQRGD
jgi:hypothetical protein